MTTKFYYYDIQPLQSGGLGVQIYVFKGPGSFMQATVDDVDHYVLPVQETPRKALDNAWFLMNQLARLPQGKNPYEKMLTRRGL